MLFRIHPKNITAINRYPTDFLRTISQTFSNVRRNPFQNPFSLKINTLLLITQYDIISIIGIFNNFKMPIMPKMPHVFVYSRLSYFFEKVFVCRRVAKFGVGYYYFIRTRIVLLELREIVLLEKHRHQPQVSALDEICQQKHEDHCYLVCDHFLLLMPSNDFLFDE